MSHSQRSVDRDWIPQSQRSHSDRPRRERPSHNGSTNVNQEAYRSDRDRRERRSQERLSTQAPSRGQNSRAPTVTSDHNSRYSRSSLPQYGPTTTRSITENRTFSEKCSSLCSRRGILQIVEITSGLLVLICVVASFAVISGYSSAAGFASFSIDSMYSPFQGTELQKVRDADLQYRQLRAPGVYVGVAFSLVLCALTVVFLILGAKPIHLVSLKILFAELIFDSVACLGYVVAVGLYLHFIKQVNATDTCKTRESLYAGRGYTWMNCDVQGGDAAVAIFGLIAACLYLSSTILCALYIKTVREFRKNYMSHEYPDPTYNDRQPEKYRQGDREETPFQPSTLV